MQIKIFVPVTFAEKSFKKKQKKNKKQQKDDPALKVSHLLMSDRVGWVMVLNATLNNISVISWQSVVFVEETGVPGENHRPFPSQ